MTGKRNAREIKPSTVVANDPNDLKYALGSRWDQISFESETLAVRRAKRGTPSMHPIRVDELRALR
jgi:hypothetical protein